MPAVSVIIPAYQASSFIDTALQSAFSQSHPPAEVLVVNDGSPDTRELLVRLEAWRREPGLRYFERANAGPSAARNTALAVATAPLVAFLDADDWWDPAYLARQTEVLERDGLDLVYCDARLFGDGPLAGRRYMEGAPSNGDATLEAVLTLRCNIPTSCVVARRTRVLQAGGFDPAFTHSEDFDLWLRMARQGARFGYHRDVLVNRRLHAASTGADHVRIFEGQIAVYRKFIGECRPQDPLRALAERQLTRALADLAIERGKEDLRRGEYGRAREALAEARRHSDRLKLSLASAALWLAPGLLRRMVLARGRSRPRTEAP
jgi:glycosyltransferase involved in cell wall biosynthesis